MNKLSKKSIEITLPPQDQFILESAKGRTFPLAVLKLIKKSGSKKTRAEIELDDKIYDYLINQYGSDEIILYCSIGEPLTTLGAYSSDMVMSQNFLEKLGMVSKNEDWVKEARPFIKKEISRF